MGPHTSADNFLTSGHAAANQAPHAPDAQHSLDSCSREQMRRSRSYITLSGALAACQAMASCTSVGTSANFSKGSSCHNAALVNASFSRSPNKQRKRTCNSCLGLQPVTFELALAHVYTHAHCNPAATRRQDYKHFGADGLTQIDPLALSRLPDAASLIASHPTRFGHAVHPMNPHGQIQFENASKEIVPFLNMQSAP